MSEKNEKQVLADALREAIDLRVKLYQNGCDCGPRHTCNAEQKDPYAKKWGDILSVAMAQQPQGEAPKYCSDERPCINCFADNGPCLDAPVAQGLVIHESKLFDWVDALVGLTEADGVERVIAEMRAILAQCAPRADHSEDARDAARYRWLRETGRLQAQLVGRCAGDKLDAAIDAAMSAGKEGA